MNHPINLRRLLGTVFLLAAFLMLVAGLTVLRSVFGPAAMLAYWAICMLLTCGAILCAVADAFRSLAQSRCEQRTLLEGTLREIEAGRDRSREGVGQSAPETR
jgi:hypothetical protein